MLTVEEYSSGKIFEYMKGINLAAKLLKVPFVKKAVNAKLSKKINSYRGDFILASLRDLEDIINSARKVAVGPRICYHLYKIDLSYAIFLDELADSLINAGYAAETSKEDAVMVMKKGRENGHLQLVSKVSGKPLELCNQSLRTCCLWKLERAGLRIIERTARS